MQRSGVDSPTRKLYEVRVLELLRVGGAMTRAELAEASGITRSTISEIVTEMLDRGAVVVAGTDISRAGRGRRAERIQLDPTSGQYLGIDIVHDGAHIVVTNASHTVIASHHYEYPAGNPFPERLALIIEHITALADEKKISLADLQGIGVGIPGPFSAATESNPDSVLVRETLRNHFNAEVIVENNVRLAALGEAIWDLPTPLDCLLYLRLAAGVGGGVIITGVPLTGAHGAGGELGHIDVGMVTDPCRCGDTGCLEMVASTPALLAAATDAGVEVSTLAEFAANAGDEPVRAIIDRACEAIATVLISAIRVVDPSDVIIAGDLFTLLPDLRDRIGEEIRSSPLTRRAGPIACREPRLSGNAGALGAICAVLDVPRSLLARPRTVSTTA